MSEINEVMPQYIKKWLDIGLNSDKIEAEEHTKQVFKNPDIFSETSYEVHEPTWSSFYNYATH